jgi:molecular chaperone IbpA
MTRLTTLDLPNFHRATIGFDQLFNELERNFANSSTNGNYPPYNIAQINDDEYMISIAVAGFGMDNLDVTQDGNELIVEGKQPIGGEDVKYLHKGIATRNFRREFKLADHVDVVSAGLEHGMLNVHLKREIPEELQPKKITITDWNGHVQEAIDIDSDVK